MFNFFKKLTKNNNQVVTRIAPSPTGVLHVGTARTALFNYLFAKQNNGKFVVRVEDTDKARSTKEFEKDILDSLSWLGLNFDEFYRQSERTEIYKKYLDKLIAEGKAYYSKEESTEEGKRSEVIRFKNPNKEIIFEDLIRGEIKFDTTELGDFVIAKSLDEPLYHLAVVVDDHEMGITHVIRGEDGISNTPRQILIQDAIGANRPKYAHLPLILGPDKTKLSKRHGATSLNAFKDQGYSKEAILNQLAFLGWNPGDEREFFTLDELINEFSIEKVGKAGAVFNVEKLDWFSKKYIDKLDKDFLEKTLKEKLSNHQKNFNEKMIPKLIPLVKERINKIGDIDLMIKEGELDCFFGELKNYSTENLIWKKSDKEKTLNHLQEVNKIISENPEQDSPEDIKSLIWNYAEQEGKGDVLWPLRYSLSGRDKSPDPFTLSYILGKESTLSRINTAINKLNENSN